MLLGLGVVFIEHTNVIHGMVQELNFDRYKDQRMADIPETRVKVLFTRNRSAGMGEAGIAVVASAVASAVARLMGSKRLRRLLILPEHAARLCPPDSASAEDSRDASRAP